MKTRFGRKMKPVLKIVGWVGGDDGGPPAQIEHKPQQKLTAKLQEMREAKNCAVNDEVPF